MRPLLGRVYQGNHLSNSVARPGCRGAMRASLQGDRLPWTPLPLDRDSSCPRPASARQSAGCTGPRGTACAAASESNTACGNPAQPAANPTQRPPNPTQPPTNPAPPAARRDQRTPARPAPINVEQQIQFDRSGLVTMHVNELDVRQLLELLSRRSGLNILVSPKVSG